MNEIFKKDYYRMTGEEYSFFRGKYHLFFEHRLKFMKHFRQLKSLKDEKGKKLRKFYHKAILYRLNRKFGLEISPEADIGFGFALFHPYNITISPSVKIGNNCNISKGVTLGLECRGKRRGAPVIGNKVFMGVNCTIVGNIHIGNNVLIAPNSYVNCDIPDNSIVLGNPCKIFYKEDATFGYVNFIVEGV